MKNPTRYELMEFVDGTLMPQRYREIDMLVSQSRHLQNEVALLQKMRISVSQNSVVPASKAFTEQVMNEIHPSPKESLLFRMIKNSSNLFAMAIVLSLITIVLVSGPGVPKSESTVIAKNLESIRTKYSAITESFSQLAHQFSLPVDQIAKSSSGKFLILGIGAFLIFVIVDEMLGKKYFNARLKH